MPKGQEKEIGRLFEELMTGNFPNVIKDMNVNITEPNKLQAWKTQTYIKMQSVSQLI